MIQANELRLGNIVLYNGMMLRVSEILSPKPRKDERFDGLHVVELLCDGLISVPINEVSGVELTEEMLLKCPEFSSNSFTSNIYHLRTPDSQFHLYYREELNRFVFRGLGVSVVYVDTLHHLQNLVYVNTGKELEIKL